MEESYANTDYYTRRMGCIASYSDAHHDFGSMLYNVNVNNLVKETTPAT